MTGSGGHDLSRFVTAQEPVYPRVLAELRAGRKKTHWMWFVFPQIEGLGRSETARFYAIRSPDEAQAYLDHPVLGARLRECVRILLGHAGLSAHEMFGTPDDLKLRSCLTLFNAVAPEDPLFGRALDMFYEGEPDGSTLAILGSIERGATGKCAGTS